MNESLDNRQLEAFVTLAKTGSYTETAKQLYVTHSAISHSIRALESQVGCRLFSKLRKKSVLTEAGEALLYHANRVLAEMQNARHTLAGLNKWGSRRLRLAADDIMLSNFLAPVLLKFRQEFPRMSLQIHSCDSNEAIHRLENNSVDLVLSTKPPVDEHIEFIPLFADRLHLVANSTHPLAAKKRASNDELGKFPFILFRGYGHGRKQLDDFLSRHGITFDIVGEIESLDMVKDMLSQAPFISFLPGWVIASELKNHSLIALPLGRKPLEQTWGFIHSRSHPMNHAESTLLKLCRKQVTKLA